MYAYLYFLFYPYIIINILKRKTQFKLPYSESNLCTFLSDLLNLIQKHFRVFYNLKSQISEDSIEFIIAQSLYQLLSVDLSDLHIMLIVGHWIFIVFFL